MIAVGFSVPALLRGMIELRINDSTRANWRIAARKCSWECLVAAMVARKISSLERVEGRGEIRCRWPEWYARQVRCDAIEWRIWERWANLKPRG